MQLIALVLTNKNKETKHYIHPKYKRETEKTVLTKRTMYTLISYTFYDLRPANGVGPTFTAVQPSWG